VLVRLLTTVALVVLVGAWPSGAATASTDGATKVVRFHGYSLRVPSSWPVYDLARDPTVCVRFDRHAVYLGRPGADQVCPSHAIGRTEALLLAPLAAASARAGGAPGGALPPSAASAQLALPAHGLLVTATWSRHPAVIAHALGLDSLRPGATGAVLRSSPAAAGTQRAGSPASSAGEATAAGALAHVGGGGVLAAAAGGGALAHAAGVYTGLGFDACSAPSAGRMSAWGASPYRGIGIYIGGANMACSQTNLTPAWAGAQSAAGWHLIPTYVGLQAPTASCGCATIDPSVASGQGAAAANDAVAHAQALGIGAGNPIYDDMESYRRTPAASAAVLAFLGGWTATLHADGYLSGVYGSANSGIRDLVGAFGGAYAEPDDIWIADWNGQQSTSEPTVPAGEWAAHQRLHQYRGAHDETYAGATLSIDGDYLDGATAGTGSAPVAASAAKTVIPDGTFVEVYGSAEVYEIAGDAPLFVDDWADVGGPDPVTTISQAQFDGLNPAPADGTFLTTAGGTVYRVAGGAPLFVGSWAGFGGAQPAVLVDQWDIDNVGNPLAHLNPLPANGTFLQTTTGGLYRVAGGAPLGVSSWARVGGEQPAVVIDEWDIDNLVDPPAHLNLIPADGTLVEGMPSRTYWEFLGGARKPIPASTDAVGVDDLALLAFAALPAPVVNCVVPGLARMTVAQARVALSQAHCRLGQVHAPRRVAARHVLRVVKQAVGAFTTHAQGYRVAVTVR
jgi:hypothetical protein